MLCLEKIFVWIYTVLCDKKIMQHLEFIDLWPFQRKFDKPIAFYSATFLELQTLPPRAGHISFNSRVIFPILIKFYRQRDTFILELPLAFPGPEIFPWFVNIPSSLAIFFILLLSITPPPPFGYFLLSSLLPLIKNVPGLFHLEVKSTNKWKNKCGLIGGERWSRFCLVLARVR